MLNLFPPDTHTKRCHKAAKLEAGVSAAVPHRVPNRSVPEVGAGCRFQVTSFFASSKGFLDPKISSYIGASELLRWKASLVTGVGEASLFLAGVD